MDIKLGPILALQDCTGDDWCVSVLVSYSGEGQPPALIVGQDGVDTQQVEPDARESFENLGAGARTVCRYTLTMPRGAESYAVQYRIAGENESWRFQVPSRDSETLRFAYASCNGFSHAKTERDVKDKFNRWQHLLTRHDEQPLHVMLLGGDQIYGDPIWERATAIRDWVEKDHDRKWNLGFTQPRERDTEKFYGALYSSVSQFFRMEMPPS